MATVKDTSTTARLVTSTNRVYSETSAAGANTYAIDTNVSKPALSLRGSGDTIFINALSSEYQVKASGKNVYLTNGDQVITISLVSAAKASPVTDSIVFLDGSLSLVSNGTSTTIGGQAVSKTYADVVASTTDNSKADDYFTAATTSTTATPTYAVAGSAASVNEGASAYFTLTTTNVKAGDQFSYILTGVSAADVVGGSLTGTATVDSLGNAIIPVTLVADATTEGTETLGISIAGKTASISVADTSLTPAAALNQTFTLTTGIDTGTSFVGGSGNDTFDATKGALGASTLGALDSIDGGAGNNTLNVAQTGNISLTSSTSVKNIQTANLVSGGTVTNDASAWTGLTTENVTSVGGGNLKLGSGADLTVTDSALAAGALTINGGKTVNVAVTGSTTGAITVGATTAPVGNITVANTSTGNVNMGAITVTGGKSVNITQTNGNAVNTTTTMGTVSVTGSANTTDVTVTNAKAATASGTVAGVAANSIAITDVNAGSATTAGTITSVSVSGLTTLGIADTALTTLSVANGSGNIIIDNSGLTTATNKTLGLTIDGQTAGTLDDADIYTNLNVTTTGTASTLANITFGAMTDLTLAGDKKLTVTSIAGATALTSISAASATGGLTIGSQLLTGTAYTGGSGVDTIILGATTKAIATGAGNDVVTLSAGTTAIGTGGTIDAGDGTSDVLSFADADDATTASAGTTFETKISNFEVVNLAGAAGAGVTVDVANLDDISKVNVAVDLGQTLAVSNIASGGTVTYEAAQTAASTITVSNAATSTADSFNVSISSAAARNVNSLTISNVETINFLTDDTATTSTGIEHTAALTAAAATKVTVAGDAGLTLTFTGTALTEFDASGVTDGDVTWTAGALAAAATVKGGATSDANVIVLSAALGNITYIGGTGTDTITMNHATNHDATTNTFTLGNGANTLTAGNNDGANTVTGGTGVDTITLGNGNNTITTSTGNDVVTVGTGGNTISVGDGNDIVTIGASRSANSVDVGAGTDAIVFSGVQTAGGYYTSVTGMGAGDTIDFSATKNGTPTPATLGAKLVLGGASSFANYLDAATAGDGSTNSAMKWFQYSGNTYIVVDNSAAATFQDGHDQVVELTGLITLTTSTQAAGVVTLV